MAAGIGILIPSSAFALLGRRSARDLSATALTDALMAALSTIAVGRGHELVEEDMVDELERGLDLFLEHLNTTAAVDATAAAAKKRKPSRAADGFVPSTIIDKVLSNDPSLTAKVVDNVNTELSYWNEHVLGDGMGDKGRLETFVKTFALRINRAALGVPFDALMTPEEIAYCKIHPVKDQKAFGRFLNKRRPGEPTSPPPEPTTVEAVLNCACLLHKLWTCFIKTSCSMVLSSPAAAATSLKNKKFDPLFRLFKLWKTVINDWYAKYLDNDQRDAALSFVRNVSGVVCANAASKYCEACGSKHIKYPRETLRDQHRVSDYAFKLYFELILSPHIHIEWKLEMAKYVSGKAIGMLGEAFAAAADDDDDNNTGSANFQPTASRFWDFCKSERPPCGIEYAIITPEPSSSPCMSSGAGLFGHLVSDERRRCPGANKAPLSVVATSTRMTNPSTRRWIEEGSVIMFNMYPLTLADAPLGYGKRAITSWKHKNAFVSSIIGAITSSRKRTKNAIDKGSRTTDLFSEGAGSQIRTVLFNSKSAIEDIASNRLFYQLLNFEGDIIGGTITEAQLKAHNTILDCFPLLTPSSTTCPPPSRACSPGAGATIQPMETC